MKAHKPHVKINNSSNDTLKVVLRLNAILDSIWIFQKVKDKTFEYLAGDLTENNVNEKGSYTVSENKGIILFFIPNNIQDLYIRVKSKYGFSRISLSISPMEMDLINSKTQLLPIFLFNGIFFGILIGFIIFNLLFFKLLKDRAYVYYSFYLIFNLIFFLYRFARFDSFFHNWFYFHPDWYPHFQIIVSIPIYIFYTLFVLSFLNVKEKWPFFYDKSLYAIYFLIAYIFIDFLIANYDLRVSWQIFYRFRIFILIVALLFLWTLLSKLESRLSIFILFGTLMLLISGLTTMILSFFPSLVFWERSFWDDTLIFLQVGILLEIICFSYGLAFKNMKIAEERMQLVKTNSQLEKNNLSIEIRHLGNQLNEHFISNCLSSITNCVNKGDTENAMKFLKSFPENLRDIMKASIEDKLTLNEEIKFIEGYIELMKLRYRGTLKFSYEKEVIEDLDKKKINIPPFILQPYVENAIEHGLRNIKDGREKKIILTVEEFEKVYLCNVKDNGIGVQVEKLAKNNHNSHGLRICKERIEAFNKLYNAEITVSIRKLDKQGTLVQLTIPKLNANNILVNHENQNANN